MKGKRKPPHIKQANHEQRQKNREQSMSVGDVVEVGENQQ